MWRSTSRREFRKNQVVLIRRIRTEQVRGDLTCNPCRQQRRLPRYPLRRVGRFDPRSLKSFHQILSPAGRPVRQAQPGRLCPALKPPLQAACCPAWRQTDTNHAPTDNAFNVGAEVTAAACRVPKSTNACSLSIEQRVRSEQVSDRRATQVRFSASERLGVISSTPRISDRNLCNGGGNIAGPGAMGYRAAHKAVQTARIDH